MKKPRKIKTADDIKDYVRHVYKKCNPLSLKYDDYYNSMASYSDKYSRDNVNMICIEFFISSDDIILGDFFKRIAPFIKKFNLHITKHIDTTGTIFRIMDNSFIEYLREKENIVNINKKICDEK